MIPGEPWSLDERAVVTPRGGGVALGVMALEWFGHQLVRDVGSGAGIVVVSEREVSRVVTG